MIAYIEGISDIGIVLGEDSVISKPNYTVIRPRPMGDYPDTAKFNGMVFCSITGKVLSRPLTNPEDFTLFGEVVFPIVFADNHVRWSTHRGINNVSMDAECFIAVQDRIASESKYVHMALELSKSNLTPSMLWKPHVSALEVIAVRCKSSGKYHSLEECYPHAQEIPVSEDCYVIF